MKFATRRTGSRDGELLIVSRDLTRAVPARDIATSLLDALERWDAVELRLAARYDDLNAGRAKDDFSFDPRICAAPLPRSPQWCDASAFLNHGRLMERAFNTPPIPDFEPKNRG
jgi:fumarylacetoacetate (FAA) hydrolase